MKEKIWISEDSLRINFIQWITNAIEKKNEKSVNFGNLIIIIDGVDKYTNETGKEESPDWLANEFPPSVRMIYTCNRDSKAYEHISIKANSIIDIKLLDFDQRMAIYNSKIKDYQASDNNSQLKNQIKKFDCCGNPLFLEILLRFLFYNVKGIRKFVCNSLEKIKSIQELIEYILDYYTKIEFKREQLSRFFRLISHTRGGISEEELLQLCNFKSSTVVCLLELFAPLLHNSDGFYIFRNDIIAKIIISKYLISEDALHLEMIQVLDDHIFTIRKIDELLNHLCESKNWMRLKDMLTKLEVFAIMFSSNYKIDLYMYWIKLEQQHFDPIQEYNKALEEFVAQYSPSSKDLVILIIQFCRFFKDFAEVEINSTCKFRHPHLRGYYELRDIDILEEIEILQGMFYSTIQNPIKEDEIISLDGQFSMEQIREKILDLQSISKSSTEFYYYKRWLWIQFPWCAIDSHSNFSATMKNFNYVSDLVSPSDEMNIFMSILKLVSSTKQLNQRELNRSNFVFTSSSKFSASPPQNKISRGLCILPEIKSQSIIIQHIEDEIKFRPKKYLSASMAIHHPEEKQSNTSIIFKDLAPDNILHKIGSSVINYTSNELIEQKRATYELQKIYNKLKEEFGLKLRKLNGLKSQIANSLDKIKEQEEVKSKTITLEMQIDKVVDKLYKSEEEGRRLKKVIDCCVKNPTRNDEWERGLEKALENMRNFIILEQDTIKIYEKETFNFEEQSKAFQKIKSQRNQAQNITLLRVKEHLDMKSKLKNKKMIGIKRRIKIFSKKNSLEFSKETRTTMKKYEAALEKIHNYKEIAITKLNGYKEMVAKLSNNRTFDDAYSLYEIISTFDRKSQLADEIESKKKTIEDITREKEALEVQLQFFKTKNLKEQEKPARYNNFDQVNYYSYMSEKKLEFLGQGTKYQEFIFIKVKTLIEKSWSKLMINQALENSNENLLKNLKTISDRIDQLNNLTKSSEAYEYSHHLTDNHLRSDSVISEDYTQKSTTVDFANDKNSMKF